MLRNDIDDCSFVPFVFWGFREKYKNRWNDKLWIWIAERQHLSLPPQQDPFISSHFAHPELRLHKARPLITAVYLLVLFVTILQNPKKTFCVTMTTTVGRVIPKHFSAKRKKINVDDKASKQQCDSVLYVFFLQISLQWGKRWLTGPLHFILHF